MCQWEYKVILVSQSPIGRVNLSEADTVAGRNCLSGPLQSPIDRVNLSELSLFCASSFAFWASQSPIGWVNLSDRRRLRE